MSVGYFLRIGDYTTCGGKILTGDPTFQWHGVFAAREGDLVNCGIHPGTYKILGGVTSTYDEGQALAGSLGSFSSCPCHARFIPSITDSYSQDDVTQFESLQHFQNNSTLLMDNLWMGFSLPKNESYSGLSYRLTMDDGSVHEGILDGTNKIFIPSLTAKMCISIEIENPDDGNIDDECLTSQLLMKIKDS